LVFGAKTTIPIFPAAWWSSNLLLALALLALVYNGVREFSVRRYLDGYSDAIVQKYVPAQAKVEAILNWMRAEPSRGIAEHPETLARRDSQTTLNSIQLSKVCGTATNAFLNLARASDLQVRRLLLLAPDRTAEHVMAEVLINRRWVVVDPSYHTIMKDAQGHLLTRKDLQDPAVFEQAASVIPNYPLKYSYEHFARVRLVRPPLEGFHLQRLFDAIYPGWEETVDWSLLLERESFLYVVLAAAGTAFFLVLRQALALYADRVLRIPRFHLREIIIRAIVAFFSVPEIKE